MEELNRKTIDRAVLVGLNADCFTKEETATETTLDELEALLNTAGGECAGKVLQNKHTPDPRSFIGEGKAEEVRQLVLETGANMVIFDNDLTPSQTRTLEDILKTTVLDRSALILDIFAQRAKTREGKLQVELAQYQYYLPRLTVWNEEMGRLGGGIGTRGPGETQLETDKRYIRSRIQKLRENLELVRKTRAEQRRRRQKNELPVVALVGYTNAGKSTLLNALTGSDIPANNRLFDTLDTTTRQLTVSDTCQALLSDTVGFIAKLPHHLVEAFRATLEELEYADLLVHVIDSADPEREDHIAVVNRLIAELAKPGTPVLECYNKCDLVPDDEIPRGSDKVAISAASGYGLDALREAIETQLGRGKHHVKLLLPYQQGDFEKLYEALEGCPVTIRFLDPPLHEFVPTEEADIEALAKTQHKSVEAIKALIASLHEFNPMMGHRGCRLTVTYPEIAKMQTAAVIRAAINVQKKHPDWKIVPEIMIPLVGDVKEFKFVKKIVVEVADAEIKAAGIDLEYEVGTMIEIPRAALTADEIAAEADFFCFGTNDLTQMTFGFSRDDAGKFLNAYYDTKIFENDPFAKLDQNGVGKLMQMTISLSKPVNPKLHCGICGEHGGDPSSVEFCNDIGLDYVSCSPFRVPIARLSAAQAAIRKKH